MAQPGLSAQQRRRVEGPTDKDEGLFSQMQLKPMTPEQLFDSLLTATRAHRAGRCDDEQPGRRDAWLQAVPLRLRQRRSRGIDQFPGDDSAGAHDDERRADASRPSPASRAASWATCCEQASGNRGRPKRSWSIRSTWRRSAGIPSPRSSARRGSTSSRSRIAFRFLQDLFWALLNSNEFVLIH